MSFFTNLRADRLIAADQVVHRSDGRRRPRRPSASSRTSGPGAIEPIIAALPGGRQARHGGLRRRARGARDRQDLPAVRRRRWCRAARASSPGVAWALTSSRGYPPHLLLEALATPGIAKSALLDVINGQRQRFSRARAAHRRLCAGAEREGGAVPHHRRGRRRGGAARAARPAAGQGPDRRACTSSTSWRASTSPRCSARCRASSPTTTR